MKKELHALYIKHDGQFKTLSKIALSQLILKIIYLRKDGATIDDIEEDLKIVLSSPVSKTDILESIKTLAHTDKLHKGKSKIYIHKGYIEELSREVNDSKRLYDKVFDRYFSKAESSRSSIESWFTDALIDFFEKYSFEWFYQVSYAVKNISGSQMNVNEILDASLLNNKSIQTMDKDWLKSQFIKFMESEDRDDNLIFWYFGISMFSSRLITARNYADGISIDLFRNSKFVLDTNILMILDLEGHDMRSSLEILESILIELNIEPVFLYITKEEYQRAMEYRRSETKIVFEKYSQEVLETSDCPFIRTAIKRGCQNGEDIDRMFDAMIDLPSKFKENLSIQLIDDAELSHAIEQGSENTDVKKGINEIYFARRGKDKRENPLRHDSGIIAGAQHLRKTDKCWIVTGDGVMKKYAIDNCIRDENEIAIGLDVVIGLMAVNNGGISSISSNFAPLFKNLVKYSLIPERNAFEAQDLAFMLRTNMKLNELSDEKVIEIAKEVRRMRVSGEDEENVSLYMRRFMEGDTAGLVREIEEVRFEAGITKNQRDSFEKQMNTAYDEIRNRRRAELRDEYDTELRNNRLKIFLLPIAIGLVLWLTYKFGLNSEASTVTYLVGCGVELVFGILPLIPINKRLVKRYSEYVGDINRKVENEIQQLKKKGV